MTFAAKGGGGKSIKNQDKHLTLSYKNYLQNQHCPP